MPDIKNIIERYLQGELSSVDKEVLLRQIKENSENRKLIFREKDIRDAIHLASPGMEENTLLQWLKLNEKIKKGEVRLKRFLSYAALFIIALALGF